MKKKLKTVECLLDISEDERKCFVLWPWICNCSELLSFGKYSVCTIFIIYSLLASCLPSQAKQNFALMYEQCTISILIHVYLLLILNYGSPVCSSLQYQKEILL